jgi:hypothetical protein
MADLIVGRVLSADDHPGARAPSYLLRVDLGGRGEREAQMEPGDYAKDDLVGALIVLSIVSALLTWVLVRRGLHTPWAVRRMNRLTLRFVDLIKRPITVAVLDEVADVIRIGHYTRNISAAIVENHDELVALVAEKVREDPASRVVGVLPGYNAVVHQVSETTLRVLVEMLGDPRMDELVSDLLRNNLEQIKVAVREREHEKVPPPPPPDPSPMSRRPRRTR